jgi:hypothetical protein
MMSDPLHEKIRQAQVAAGERVVMEHLRKLGLAKPPSESPSGEDWENACHEIVWKTDPALFDRIQKQAEQERDRRTALYT